MFTEIEVQGYCHPRFTRVKEAFAANFRAGLEVGASFAAVWRGEPVIDIWAGYADPAGERPWASQTVVNMWSTSKLITGVLVQLLADRRLIELDAPVAAYWPQFVRKGKQGVKVRHLLSHQAGLPIIEEPMEQAAWFDPPRIAAALADQAPLWEPGTRAGYHGMTQGYLLGELVQRATGKSIGSHFRELISQPFSVDFHFGLPAEAADRTAVIIPPDGSLTYRAGSLFERMMGNPAGYTADIANLPAWQQMEQPAANGHGNARSVARLMSALANDGKIDGRPLLSMRALEKASREQCYGVDAVTGAYTRYGLGYGLASREMTMGPNRQVLFWSGWGGSFGVADLDATLSYGYAMNKMGHDTGVRRKALITALYESIG